MFAQADQFGLVAAAPIAKIFRDGQVAGQEVRMQPFYFLYATDEALSRQL